MRNKAALWMAASVMGLSLTCTAVSMAADEQIDPAAVESVTEGQDQGTEETNSDIPEEDAQDMEEADDGMQPEDPLYEDDEGGVAETVVSDEEDSVPTEKKKKEKKSDDKNTVDEDGLIVEEDGFDPAAAEADPVFSLEEIWDETYVFPGFEVDPSKYPAANINVNTVKLYRFLTEELELNHAAACGLLANVQMESNFRPLALGDGGTSYGVCQWHNGRFTHLMNYCKSRELDYNTLEGQISFLGYELTHGYRGVYEALLDVEDDEEGAYDAGYLFCARFEMPDQTTGRSMQRGNLAKNEFYEKDFDKLEKDLIHKDKLLKKNWLKKLRKKYGSIWEADFVLSDEDRPDYEDQILPDWNALLGEPSETMEE